MQEHEQTASLPVSMFDSQPGIGGAAVISRQITGAVFDAAGARAPLWSVGMTAIEETAVTIPVLSLGLLARSRDLRRRQVYALGGGRKDGCYFAVARLIERDPAFGMAHAAGMAEGYWAVWTILPMRSYITFIMNASLHRRLDFLCLGFCFAVVMESPMRLFSVVVKYGPLKRFLHNHREQSH